MNTDKTALATYRAARAALRENQKAEIEAGITEETDTFRDLNTAAAEAARSVPWWQR